MKFLMIRIEKGGKLDMERKIEKMIMEKIKKEYNMDEKIWKKYIIYMGNMLNGDIGKRLKRSELKVKDILD